MNDILISNKWRLVTYEKKKKKEKVRKKSIHTTAQFRQPPDQAHSSIPRALQPGWRLLVNVQPCAGNGSYRSLRTTTGLSPRPALHSVFIHEPATFRVRVLPDTCNPDTIPFFGSEIAMPRTTGAMVVVVVARDPTVNGDFRGFGIARPSQFPKFLRKESIQRDNFDNFPFRTGYVYSDSLYSLLFFVT